MAIFYDIMADVVTQIKALSLVGIADDNIVLIKVNPERETVVPGLPGVLVLPVGVESMPPDAGTMQRDDIGYPVGVIMCDQQREDQTTGQPPTADGGNVDQDYEFNRDLLWRERIRKQFSRKRLPNVNTFECQTEPGDIIDPLPFFEANLWMSTLVLRFWSREDRVP